jgi:nicotinate phosphoribosyltransferase
MLRRCPLLLDGRALLDADALLRAGLAERRASFELSFEGLPPHTGFAVIAGIESFLDALYRLVIDDAQLEAAQRLGGFSDRLRLWLSRLSPGIDVDAVPDGTLAFARTPIASVEGPLIEAVVVGALLRATVQRATAVATRTARLYLASGGDAIIDGASAHAASADASLAIARWAFVGGASATTNVLAAISLSIPFRGATALDLGTLAPAALPAVDDGWGSSPADTLQDLGAGDDEEALLIEKKRLRMQAGGWIARGLADCDARAFPMRYELVALEQSGAWAPRRGVSNKADVVPGRKRVVRYANNVGRAVADVIHLTNERMHSPQAFGASTLTPLARAVMRDGRMLEAPEAPLVGRERAIAARPSMPPEVTHLRHPGAYRVELSPGLLALRNEL